MAGILLLAGARGGAVAQAVQRVSFDAGNGTGGTGGTDAARQLWQTSTPLPQYSFFVAGASTIEHLHGRMNSALSLAGFREGWQRLVDGQRIQTWYSAAKDSTAISVRWAQEGGFVQSASLIPGQIRAEEVGGLAELLEVAASQSQQQQSQGQQTRDLQTLEQQMQAFAMQDADEQQYQATYQALLERLGQLGFTFLQRHQAGQGGVLETYMAWYQPDLDMTALLISWPTGSGYSQSVVMIPERLESDQAVPSFGPLLAKSRLEVPGLPHPPV